VLSAPIRHPFRPVPVPRPLTHRRYLSAMTVCIAAHAVFNRNPKIVLCCDTQVGDDLSTSRSDCKWEWYFGDGLASLMSGTVEHGTALVNTCKAKLRDSKWKTLADLREELRAANDQFKADLFRAGKKQKHDVQIIVSGFVERSPVIVVLDHSGTTVHQTHAAVGSGGWNADMILRWREKHEPFQPFRSTLNDIVYRVYEAKQFGELSPHVGKETVMMVLGLPPVKEHLEIEFIGPHQEEFLSREFSRYGPQLLPQQREQIPDFPKMVSDTGGQKR